MKQPKEKDTINTEYMSANVLIAMVAEWEAWDTVQCCQAVQSVKRMGDPQEGTFRLNPVEW